MPAASYEGHGGLEQIAGETFGQQVGFDPSAYDLYGYDPAMDQRRAAQGKLSAAQQAAQSADAAIKQFEAEHRDELAKQAAHPGDASQFGTIGGGVARGFLGPEQAQEYERLKAAAAQAQQGAQAAQATFTEEMAGMGPTKFDTEQERLLAAAGAKQPTFEEMAGPYLDALQKSKGEMEAATGLYGKAARGEGPSAAQSQFQGALDQSNRMAMARAGSMRGGALNQVSAQRDAAMQAGQTEAQAASQSASLRAQEMQAAMAGYAQAAGQVGQLDQNTAQMATQAGLARQQNLTRQQALYEQLRAQGYSQQAAMNQAREQFGATMEQQQRAYDIGLSNLQHGRQNEGVQAALGMAQGGMQAAAGVGGAMITGGATTAAAEIAAKAKQAAGGGGGGGGGNTMGSGGMF